MTPDPAPASFTSLYLLRNGTLLAETEGAARSGQLWAIEPTGASPLTVQAVRLQPYRCQSCLADAR